MPDICPKCGKSTVGGMCLDCGIIEDTAPDKNITAEEIFDDDTPDEQPSALADVKAPELASTNGEEFVPKTFSEPPKRSEKVNPYADVIPYERPDYGDNYVAPDTVVSEYGVPKAIELEDDKRAKLLIKGVRLKKTYWYSYWWIMLIAILLSVFINGIIGTVIGGAMLKFDEKGGKTAGIITMAICLPLALIQYVTYRT